MLSYQYTLTFIRRIRILCVYFISKSSFNRIRRVEHWD